MSFQYGFTGFDESISLISAVFSAIPSIAISVTVYVLTAMGLYTLAKRRGIQNAWLAWIPVADSWIVGSLSDQFRYLTKGQYRAKRKSLLVLRIISAVLAVVFFVLFAAFIYKVITAAVHGYGEQQAIEAIMTPLLEICLLALPMAGVGIAYIIIYYMALYDIYTSMDPSNNVLFLVLSIFINVTAPFFLFFNREKDLGMPARRPVPVQPQWSAPTDNPEPWNNPDYQ